jgi:myo-inositol-1(or 4)-monophosphatase
VREILLPQWGKAEVIDKKTASSSDVLTALDQKVEKFLREKLAEVYPDIQFVGEEEGGNREAERFWLVDPIDGTGHYVRGLPFCTSMLALIEDGVVTFSVIYDFLNDDMYWAEKGKGAYKNDSPIHVSDRSLTDSYICMESKMYKKYNQEFFGRINTKAPYFSSVDCGWEFAMVACGKLDGRISFDPWGYDYDFAPGALLVSEAGGIVVNIGSSEYDYKNINFIAAGPKVYKELEEIFKDYKCPLD